MAETKKPQGTVVVIDGSMNKQGCVDLRKQLVEGMQRAKDQGHKELLISWENPGDIDGIGLALLLATYLEFNAAGGQVCLRGFSEKHQELLRITRTDSLFLLRDEAA